jgi:hypothetical protein
MTTRCPFSDPQDPVSRVFNIRGQGPRAGVWGRLHEEILHRLDDVGLLDLSRAVLDSAHVRAKRGELTGPSPVDRGKPGSRMHVLSDANGLPPLAGLSAANTHDSLARKPMLLGAPNETRPPPRPTLQARAPICRQGIRHPSPAAMALGQAHRRAYRPQGSRVQRTLRTPPMGHRAHHVLADGLPQTQPPIRTPPPQLPGFPRPRSLPLLLQTTRSTQHIGHGLKMSDGT